MGNLPEEAANLPDLNDVISADMKENHPPQAQEEGTFLRLEEGMRLSINMQICRFSQHKCGIDEADAASDVSQFSSRCEEDPAD